MAGRFIKLYDKLLTWGWFKKPNTLSLFIYLLLKANYCDLTFEGQVIHRGQLVTSLPTMARETGQTIKEVRTALGHLIETGEVADYSTNRYRVITVVKYDEYQKDGRQNGSQRAGKGQAKGRQNGSQGAASIEYIENIEDIESIDNKNIYELKKTNKRFAPPSVDEVALYCAERHNHVDATKFVDYYSANGWRIGKNPMKDWKAAVRTWERSEFTEKDYQYERQHSGLPY